MTAESGDALLTAGAIAKALGASDAKVKKAIQQLAIKPKAKKGACSYYGPETLAKLRKAVSK